MHYKFPHDDDISYINS